MDFGQQRLQQQGNARSMMYQNHGYQFERGERQTFIVDIKDGTTVDTNPLTNASQFSVDLFEPLIIDKHSDIYLDSFLTYNSLLCHTGDTMAFSLQINEFNLTSNTASTGGGQHSFNRILIPNEHNDTDDIYSCVVHKGKKMNYICSINPCKLSTITGKITDLAGESMFTTSQGSQDDSRLYYVSLDDPVTASIPIGTVFGFSAGASATGVTGFTTAVAMDEGTTDLFFYEDTETISNITTARNVDSDFPGLGDAGGGSVLAANVSTFKIGYNARFIAEFVIVARE